MTQQFVYGTRLRPPGLGAVPRDGLIEISCEEYTSPDRHYWGTATYDRRLTDKELNDYEMDFLYEHRIY